jgi:hypothetical protein
MREEKEPIEVRGYKPMATIYLRQREDGMVHPKVPFIIRRILSQELPDRTPDTGVSPFQQIESAVIGAFATETSLDLGHLLPELLEDPQHQLTEQR